MNPSGITGAAVDGAEVDYAILAAQAEGLLSGQRHRVANAANLSALIFEAVPRINWAGFYFVEDGRLVLGPFQGKPACVEIEIGKGVCGTAAHSRNVQRIDDVHEFEGHIACDVASRSELVIPLIADGEVIGVLDIDSPEPGRFSESDAKGFSRLAEIYLDSIA